MDDFSKLDAVGQAELVRTRQVSPVELVEAAIARIESIDSRLNAVIHPLFEHARERARGPLPDGPFRGVPFLLKDLDATMAGVPFNAGMEFLKQRGYQPSVDAYYTRQILEAGFVVVGKTNTPELGLTVTHGATGLRTEPQPLEYRSLHRWIERWLGSRGRGPPRARRACLRRWRIHSHSGQRVRSGRPQAVTRAGIPWAPVR